MAKIFVIDDDPDVVEIITTVLTKEGHDVSSAGNRADGMKGVDENKPDLLVLDCMLEQADDGLVIARELRNQGFDKPILMLSSINMVTGMQFEKDDDILPVDEFQSKPVDPADFVAKINELLK